MKLFKRTKLNSKGFSHVEAVLAVVIVAAITAVGVRVIGGSHAAAPITNGKIYSSDMLVNPDGTDQTYVPSPSGFASQYSNISSDGTKIAYLSSPGYNSISTMTINGTGNKVITTVPAATNGTTLLVYYPPMWSPNDQWIATPYQYYGGKKKYDYNAIWVTNLSGSDAYSVKIPQSELPQVAWMPNSDAFAYVYSKTQKDGYLCTISITGTNDSCNKIKSYNKKALSLPPSGYGGIAVAPSGSQVALLGINDLNTQSGPTQDVYLASIGGSLTNQLTQETNNQQIQTVVWSPDGTKLAYILGSNLYVMNSSGTGSTLVSKDAHPDSLSWAQ